MGWIAITRKGEVLREDQGVGRPVDAGNNGELLVIAQEDYGHTVAVDLVNGAIAIDYESLGVQNGTIELANPKLIFMMNDETNIAGDMFHIEHTYAPAYDEDGNPMLQADGTQSYWRNDRTWPLTFRPIWFSRHTTNIAPIKVIGLQTTLPEINDNKNIKKLICLYSDGRIGID